MQPHFHIFLFFVLSKTSCISVGVSVRNETLEIAYGPQPEQEEEGDKTEVDEEEEKEEDECPEEEEVEEEEGFDRFGRPIGTFSTSLLHFFLLLSLFFLSFTYSEHCQRTAYTSGFQQFTL
jgi:hypothetical protein